MGNTSWGEIEALILAAARQRPDAGADPVVAAGLDDDLTAAITSLVTRTSPSAGAVRPLALSAGDRVGPYCVVRRLGVGGMGEVFLARDNRLDRDVALKCLLPSDAADHDLRDRIVREARLAARISHPHIATVHDVVEQNGRAFIVMEYVEGESLATLLKREPMTEPRVLEIGRQLASALVAAHAVGIVHRDLKPANIQMTPHGSAKILDFGIATVYAAMTATAEAGATTVAGLTMPAGTLGYMSPEQLLGRGVDERSDLFSLAAVLFEMATGRRAFDARDPLDNLVAIIRRAPRADGTGRQITERVADVIARGLEPDPRNRYQSAAEMLAALDAIRPTVTESTHAARRYGAAAGAAVLVPLAVWLLGRISCAVYDNTFERTGTFAAETAGAYFVWGVKSLVAPSFYGAVAALTYGTGIFLFRLVTRLPAVQPWQTSARVRLRILGDKLALNDPVNLAQGLAALGLLAVALVTWWFNRLIFAWGAYASTGDAAQLQPLGPDNNSEKFLYRFLLTALLLVFSAGLLRVLQLRRRLAMRRGRASVAALTTIVLCLVLLNEVPYRIMWGRSYRASYAGQRCYIIGESPSDYLLFCPAAAVPRNRVVGRDDPALQQTTFYENVFSR